MSQLHVSPDQEPGNQAGDIVLVRAQLRETASGGDREKAVRVTALGVIDHSLMVSEEQRPSPDWFGLHHFVSFFAYRAYGIPALTDHVPSVSAMNIGNYWLPDVAIMQNFGQAQHFSALLRHPTAPSSVPDLSPAPRPLVDRAFPGQGDLLLIEEAGDVRGIRGRVRAAALMLAYQPGISPGEPFCLHVLGREKGRLAQMYTRFSAARISLARDLGQAVWAPLEDASLSGLALPMAHRHDPWGMIS